MEPLLIFLMHSSTKDFIKFPHLQREVRSNLYGLLPKGGDDDS
jgi:hypothetical protein